MKCSREMFLLLRQFILIICFGVVLVGTLDQGTLLKLRSLMEENPLLGWIHRAKYASLEDLGLTRKEVNRSIIYSSPRSQKIRALAFKALKGEPIRLAVLGGSISAGATLYKNKNEDKIYFRGFSDWWNNILATVTKSTMTTDNFAIGATGSDYFAYCLENFVQINNTDLVIWELSANDYHRFDNRDVPPTMPMELLIRNLLRLDNGPAVLGVHFFRGQDYIKEGDCNNLEGDGADYILRYYSVPIISWRKLICKKLIASGAKGFRKVFASDDSHPSILGHAHVTYLIIEYFRSVFKDMINELLLPGQATTNPKQQVTIPVEEPLPIIKAIYSKSQLVSQAPICYTFCIPSSGAIPSNNMKIRVLRNDKYVIAVAHGFIVRKDKTRGLRTKMQGNELHLLIDVPVQTTPHLKDWMILVGTYSNLGGAVFFLNGHLSRVIETEKYAYGSIVAAVATHVPSGRHVLVIKSLKKGFFLSSVMLG